jgi:outer membrane protein OmpA-like peptidoglycan-associated protein
MGVHKKTAIAMASVLALSACEGKDFFADGKLFDSWTQEAGSFIDEGQFGNPTRQNTLIQTGQRSFVVDLNNRFSAEVTPMVNFAFDSARLDEEARTILRKQASWIRQFPEVRFKVFGHTDLVGSDAYNKRLGLRRARAVVNYLSNQGIDRSRLQAVVSYGETQPLIVTQDRERRNRRTVTEVSGLAKKNPAYMNGKYAEVLFREYVQSATEDPTRLP